MKIHEFQAKRLLAAGGIPCPEGHVIHSDADSEKLKGALSDRLWVVKAQVHAGGRGKGRIYKDGNEVSRGVQLTHSEAEALAAAARMLGGKLVTVQTGEAGKIVHKVLVEKGVEIAAEFYLAIIVDRETSRVAVMASTEGGTEIEEVAALTPEKIHTEYIDPLLGFKGYHARNLASKLQLDPGQTRDFGGFVAALYNLFLEKDCSMLEVNPLVWTGEQFLAVDAKVNFDDNALYRHPALLDMRDLSEEEPLEVEAAAVQLNYIKLDGDIGCLVNGAGLAMATMDTIKEFGGEPANFLDVGGTATAENVAKSFEIMLKDDVSGIFVNVFGGIVRCDVVAQGLVDALGSMELTIPLVVRLAGNRMREAVALLEKSGLPIITASDMKDGAEKIVAACRR
jgi:succinyl-CoA synthetase beta subunit